MERAKRKKHGDGYKIEINVQDTIDMATGQSCKYMSVVNVDTDEVFFHTSEIISWSEDGQKFAFVPEEQDKRTLGDIVDDVTTHLKIASWL